MLCQLSVFNNNERKTFSEAGLSSLLFLNFLLVFYCVDGDSGGGDLIIENLNTILLNLLVKNKYI